MNDSGQVVYTHTHIQVFIRDSIGTGTGMVPGGTTSLRSGLGTFFVLTPGHAKCFC